MSKAAVLLRWLRAVPRAAERAREDVDAIVRNDPAARSALEVVLVYPGLHALWIHRVAHALWRDEDRPPAGPRSGETAVVGDGCLLYKGVVLGGTSIAKTRRHPTLHANVVVGSNACIQGAIEVGEGARIGSGSVIR